MKKLALLFSLAAFFLLAACLSGCGNSSQVPDSMLQLAVDERFSEKEYTWSATHHYDSQARTDTVNLTATLQEEYGAKNRSCKIVYQYDRASDTWSVYSKGEWSEPSFQFNSKLIGSWEGTYTAGDSYRIQITAVSGNSMTVSGKVTVLADSGPLSYTPCTISFSGTYQTNSRGNRIEVPLESHHIPNGFMLAPGESEAAIVIHLDEDTGVEDVFGPELWTER